MRRSTRQLTAGILLAGALAASADAALIAHYPLKDGGAGTPVTGAAEVIDGDAGVHKNAVVTSPGAPGGTWFNDPSRGIVFSTGEDDRLFAGTQGIDRAVGFTWSLWANVASSNLTDSGADVLIGTRAASGGARCWPRRNLRTKMRFPSEAPNGAAGRTCPPGLRGR